MSRRKDARIGLPNFESRYEERVEIPGLTLYEVHREPQNVDTDPSNVMVLTNAMSQELTCPICLDVLKDTHVVKECMHRFCGVCITKALREGHFCPACRVHVSTRRSLRSDSNFDALIRRIYPNLEEYEREQHKVIEDENRKQKATHAANVDSMKRQSTKRKLEQAMAGPMPPPAGWARSGYGAASGGTGAGAGGAAVAAWGQRGSAAAGLAANGGRGGQGAQGPKRVLKPGGVRPGGGGAQGGSPSATGARNADAAWFNFILRRHPDEQTLPLLPQEALRTPEKCTVLHVKKWLAKKLNLQADFEILVLGRTNTMVVLDNTVTLRTISENYWGGSGELVLHFRSGPGDVAGGAAAAAVLEAGAAGAVGPAAAAPAAAAAVEAAATAAAAQPLPQCGGHENGNVGVTGAMAAAAVAAAAAGGDGVVPMTAAAAASGGSAAAAMGSGNPPTMPPNASPAVSAN